MVASDSAALAVGFGGTILRSLAAPNLPAVVTPPAPFDQALTTTFTDGSTVPPRRDAATAAA